VQICQSTPSQKALTYFKIIHPCRRHQPSWSVHPESFILGSVTATLGVPTSEPSAADPRLSRS
jgi:hypothetical protein